MNAEFYDFVALKKHKTITSDVEIENKCGSITSTSEVTEQHLFSVTYIPLLNYLRDTKF